MIAAKKPNKRASALPAIAWLAAFLPLAGQAQLPAANAPRKKGSTIVTAEKESTFDNESRRASFSGKVKVTDPEFELTCDELVVFLRDPKAEPEKAGGSSSGLSKAIADGHVIVIQRRTAEDGTEKIYRGKADHGVYDATTEEFVLSGSPEVQQGINTHTATEPGTTMTIMKNGKMRTVGGSRTTIQEAPDEP